ncbi:3-hydroxyacyl-CoA dehydrogenase NAD-binding domain-containing protein [Amycolatopsis sp. NPDC004772]
MTVHLQREREVALLVIDNPPVNTSTAALRADLVKALAEAAADDSVRAVVLIGADRHFVSGSDLREFEGDLPRPELPEVIAAIDACPKPVVAALSGTALGGGFELALGCDARIAVAGTRIGLPEVTLGMIPGAGGTQRTLRLARPSRVLDLVTSGKAVEAEQARDDGLIDEVVPGALRDEAIAYARRVERKRNLLEEPVCSEEPGALEDAARRAVARYGARPAVLAAIGAVFTGLALPAATALRHERAEFHRLRTGREAAARRHLFFARTATRKATRPAGASPAAVGVVGAGTMGAGIARAFLEAGVAVTLVDRNRSTLDAAKAGLERACAHQVVQGLLTTGDATGDLAAAGLVIEAVFEDHTVKADVLAELEKVTADGTPLATNTSYLDIDVLAAELSDPARLVGLHFFSPAHRSEVVEVVRGKQTSDASMDAAFAAAHALRKVPVVAGVCEGFIGNRIFHAYRRQCELLVEDGAHPADVDAALTGFGFAMGPFAVADLAGLDIAWRNRRRHDAGRDPRERYPDVADRLVDLGRLGQKTSAGWYRYEPGSRTPLPDPVVDELIELSRTEKGMTPRHIGSGEIVERALLAMANEAALVLADGIAAAPGDIDLLLTLGYGFPGHEGGIAFWAAGQEPAWLERAQQRLAQAAGWGFRAGDLALLA